MSNFTDFVSQVNQSIHSVNVSELVRALLSTNLTSTQLVGKDSIFPVQISLSVILGLIPVIIYLLRRSRKHVEKPTKFEFPAPEEAKPNWKGRRLIPADISQEDDPDHIYCYCPATAQFLGKFKSNTKEEIDSAIGRARKAHDSFYHDPDFTLKRRKVLRTLNEFIIRNQASIARVACRDSGKTMVDASMGEIMVTLEKINWILNNGEAALKPSRRPGPSSMLMKYKKAEVWYEPRGVVGALVSWNYPFHNMLNPVVAAIFTGNGIVVKCSERVRWSSEYFVNLVKTALRVCDIDPDLVQLICCWGKDGDLVSGNPGFDHLTFIGSIPVAKRVLRAASEVVTPVVVELGGKDAVLICEDYLKKKGVDGIASVVMRGTFQSAGQNCIGIERVIVSGDDSVYEKFVQTLSKRVSKLRVGSDIDQNEEIDMGAMIMGGAKFDELESWVADAVDHGARLLHGGKRYIHPNYPQGHYFEPTLLVDVDPTCTLATNEVFGPVLCVTHAKDDVEALTFANSTIFGLGGAVFTTDFTKAKRITAGMRTGNVAINDFATFYVCQLPFGGVGDSGYGKFGGEEGLRGLCLEKSVCYDKSRFIATSIPKVIDYPISNGKKAWKFVSSMCKAGYDYSLWERLKALTTLAKNAN
ncbi:DEKNAAC102013 [Brettanomyces naardenensis]|uniref:DEKNAAC102013 n=1 Tax=Brettanomyces naardenensis TaxID=13370 RepID=A0A448YJK8_BRENA|nr:DEKNAAC102013 [Brettanomyces naardenensis]